MSTYLASLANGVNAAAAYGQWQRFSFGGTWAAGETWTLTLTDLSGDYTIGAGRVTGLAPSFALTFRDKLYAVADDTLLHSDLADPTGWERQHVGAGLIQMSNQASQPEALAALAPYQGGLAVFARRHVQIWGVDPNPADYEQRQILPNVGTVAPLSVQAVGDMDVYFLGDSGIRSLRVRDASSNAILADMGTPIDTLVKPALAALTDAQKATSCGVVDPADNRYWCFIPNAAGTDGTIYVLSYFPSSNVQAWSTYLPTYDLGGTQTAFVPSKFAVVDGQVFCRAGDKIFAYGGEDGNTYDAAVCGWRTPYHDAKTPGTGKQFHGVDAAMEGGWVLSASADPKGDLFDEVYRSDESSFWLGTIPFEAHGTHVALDGQTTGSGYARFSSALIHFDPAETG